MARAKRCETVHAGRGLAQPSLNTSSLVTCHTAKWPPHVNRRRAAGVTRLRFNGYDIVLFSQKQKQLVDNVVIQEPLGSSEHSQLHFNIKIKSDKTKVKQVGGILGKVTVMKSGTV